LSEKVKKSKLLTNTNQIISRISKHLSKNKAKKEKAQLIKSPLILDSYNFNFLKSPKEINFCDA
jgi:hypothetical protein